jgi:hypothetical protein
MKTIDKLFYSFCLFFLLAGCGGPLQGGTESGNPTKLSIKIVGYQSSELQGSGSKAITVGSLNIDTAKVVLDELRFRPFSACQNGEEEVNDVLINGPFVVDLLHPTIITGLENVQVLAGKYCRIELILKKLNDEEVPSTVDPSDPIVNRSIIIEGKRGDGTPFSMMTEFDEEFKLENETTGFEVGPSFGVQDLIIAFDFDQWFLSLNLFDPQVEISNDENNDPIIMIDDNSNENIQETVEDNVKRSADLFEDKDNDDELDVNELDSSLAEGEVLL